MGKWAGRSDGGEHLAVVLSIIRQDRRLSSSRGDAMGADRCKDVLAAGTGTEWLGR